MRYQLAIFDFDGTLADSYPLFVSVFNELAQRHGFRRVAPEEIPALRRLGAREIMRHLGMPARKLPAVTKDFVARMRERRASVAPFRGATQLLAELDRAGVHVGIVSSNAQDNVAAILGAEAMSAVQACACGMSIFGKRAHLRKVLKLSGVDRARALYIGDQATDLQAAHAERLAFGAVAWGYGDASHLRQLGAQHVFREIAEIALFFKG